MARDRCMLCIVLGPGHYDLGLETPLYHPNAMVISACEMVPVTSQPHLTLAER